jgi:RNA polymerase sigma-70 factor (ECF subfamily)
MDFETAYTTLFTPLYRYTFMRVRNYDESMDILQTVFLKVFERYANLGAEEVRRIMYASLRNEIVDRSRKKRPILVEDAAMTSFEDPQSIHPQRQVEKQEALKKLSVLLESLNDEERDIVILRYINEEEYATIAEMFGKREAAVRKIVSRALEKLRTNHDPRNF